MSAWRYHLHRKAKRGSDDATSSSSGSRGKHRKTGIDPNWAAGFPWMVACDDGAGMLCSLCRKHNRRPKNVLVGRAIWVDLPCKNLTRQSLVGHGRSACHTLAIIEMTLDRVVSAERKAFIGALKCMLAKREIAHTTNFVPILELGKSLGATYLKDISVGGNAQYTSERFVQEVIQALGETISSPILSSVRQSPFFSVCIDVNLPMYLSYDIDFTVVKPLVASTKAAIDALLLVPGDCFSTLPKVLPELEEFGVQQPTDHQVQQFKQHVRI